MLSRNFCWIFAFVHFTELFTFYFLKKLYDNNYLCAHLLNADIDEVFKVQTTFNTPMNEMLRKFASLLHYFVIFDFVRMNWPCIDESVSMAGFFFFFLRKFLQIVMVSFNNSFTFRLVFGKFSIYKSCLFYLKDSDAIHTQRCLNCFAMDTKPKMFLMITKNITLISWKVENWLKASSKQEMELNFWLRCKFFWTNFGLPRTPLTIFLCHKIWYLF